MKATALIAEDEPLLASALQLELEAAWPDLDIVCTVGDGLRAVSESLRLLPQVVFLDIRMPGLDGLSAAMELADSWPAQQTPLPQLVFVTAYDEYAARAFEAQAIDYVLKPVQPDRLRKSVARVQQALAATHAGAQRSPVSSLSLDAIEQTLAQWRQAIAAGGASAGPGAPTAGAAAPLKFIAASDAGGNTVRMVPVQDVVYFEAADKYVRVLTATHEYLIRTPLKQLLPQLDAGVFWQIHRAIVVRSDAVEVVQRDESGKMHLQLRGRPESIPVSRLYAHLFRAM